VVVGSAAMRRYLIERDVTPGKIFAIYPTADDHFFSVAQHRSDIRKKYALDPKVVVGFVGSMAPYHRVELLLQAALELRRVSNAVHFMIVGDGRGMSELERFVKDNAMESCVTFTRRIAYSEVPEYVGAMDICVIPHATWYGSPTKLFEYAASGKPIIAPRIGPIQEFIRDGENGVLVEPGNVNQLATKILQLTDDSVLRNNLGAQLKLEISRDHTWDKNTDNLISVFESLRNPRSRKTAGSEVTNATA
jgi:glycosyltransferase involved in cell wall biosynthesis